MYNYKNRNELLYQLMYLMRMQCIVLVYMTLIVATIKDINKYKDMLGMDVND